MTQALRNSLPRRLLLGWRIVVTAVTPLKVVVWATDDPRCTMERSCMLAARRWSLALGGHACVNPSLAGSGAND